MFVEAGGAGKNSRARAKEGYCMKMEAYLCFISHLPVQSHATIHQHRYRYDLISLNLGGWLSTGTPGYLLAPCDKSQSRTKQP